MNPEAKVFTPSTTLNSYEDCCPEIFDSDFLEDVYAYDPFLYEDIPRYGYIPPLKAASLIAEWDNNVTDEPLSADSCEDKTVEQILNKLMIESRSLRKQVQFVHDCIGLIDEWMKGNNLVFIGLRVNVTKGCTEKDENALCIKAIVYLCNDVLQVPIAASDVSTAYRMHNVDASNPYPPIMVRFCCKLVRDEVYRRWDVLASFNERMQSDAWIYMYEDVTWSNQRMKALPKHITKKMLTKAIADIGYVIVECEQGCVHLMESVEDVTCCHD